MNITNARYTDAAHAVIAATVDGTDMTIPAAPGNRHYAALVAEGVTIAPYEATPVDLPALAADLRWKKETGGTVWNGWPVHTDRESQQKIAAERMAVMTGDRTDGEPWKFADNEFRSLTNAEVEALATSVRSHVKDCFALEGQALTGIADGTLTTAADVEAVFA